MTFTCRSSIRVWATNPGCLLVLFGLLLLPGSVSVDIVSQTITASVTETVILPCHITVDGELPTVEWSKEGLEENNITLLYRDGCETFGMKNPAFHYRTNLLLNKLKDGNISQIIYNPRVSDGGKYYCRTLRGRQWQVHAIIILKVGATSKPELTVVPSTDGGGLTLECKAECWFPEPDITFHDDERNEIPAGKPTRGPNSRECFTVTRRAVVQTKINRVTCKVHDRELNQTKNTEIYIPDDWMRSCLSTAAITGIVTFLLTGLIICGLVFLVHKMFCRSGQNSCRSRNTQMKEENEKDEMESHTSRHSGTSQEEESTGDSRTSPNGTELVDQSLVNNRPPGQNSSTTKSCGSIAARRDKTPDSPNTDQHRSVSSSSSKGNSLVPPRIYQRSLSYRSNASESSESLLEKP
ncbi:butyrophilin subfamily 3 member A2-like [Gambusia affinis]|uniref:butyrophilin subfamily 3 member A2-like n=1 Tax=Gambusia affinis TaxID=33528 RepID=UPI001CDC20CC|nr:butyrophilin subfamily 3 member A2-like [Gambusia affinis]